MNFFFSYVAQTAFREVTEHMMEISKASDHSIQKKIQSLLNDNNIDNNLKNKIMSVFKEESLSDLYSKINTRHKLHKFVKENFDFIQIQELKRDGECFIIEYKCFAILTPKKDILMYWRLTNTSNETIKSFGGKPIINAVKDMQF